MEDGDASRYQVERRVLKRPYTCALTWVILVHIWHSMESVDSHLGASGRTQAGSHMDLTVILVDFFNTLRPYFETRER
jgi:hypothetical protein